MVAVKLMKKTKIKEYKKLTCLKWIWTKSVKLPYDKGIDEIIAFSNTISASLNETI
jgi:hypothetical protein